MNTYKFSSRFFILVLAFIALSCDDDNRKVSVAENEVSYASTVTRAEAAKIAKYLEKASWAIPDGHSKLKLSKSELDYEIDWYVGSSFFPFPEDVALLRRLGDSLSANVLKGRRVDMTLLDEDYYSGWYLGEEAHPMVSVGEGVLYYKENVRAEEAQAVADLLAQIPFFTEKRRVLEMVRYSDEYNIRIALKEEWRNERFLHDLGDWASQINRKVFPDARVYAEACDHLFHVMEVAEGQPYSNTFDLDRMELAFTNDISWAHISSLQVFIENCLNSEDCHAFYNVDRITLERKEGVIHMALPVNGSLLDASNKAFYQDLVEALSSSVFSNEKVFLRIYDQETWGFELLSS